MMQFTYKLLLIGSMLFMSACSTNLAPRGWKKVEIKNKSKSQHVSKFHKQKMSKSRKKYTVKKKHSQVTRKRDKFALTKSKSYKKFRKNTNLRKSFKVYKNAKLLSKSTSKNTKLTIDISEQRVKLYVNNAVALDAPCTTGSQHKFEPNTKIYRDKRTPKGTFRITEKIRNKRSSIFGDYYRGKKRVYHGDRRKFKGSKKGLRYQGASLKNWMRLTSSGVGLHASKYVKRNPGTNGCIRLPAHIAQTIFSKVQNGTPVTVKN